MARTTKHLSARIESVTLKGEGVARVEGKVYFIDGALPGEQVEFEVRKSRKRHAIGRLVRVAETDAGSGRVEPDCRYSGVCGGCSLRHYQRNLQLDSKQQSLIDALSHIGNVTPLEMMPAIAGDWIHYRRKARLGIRYVDKKGGALVGFREKNSHYITPLERCLTLTEPLSDLLVPLTALLNRLSIKRELPQIEVAEGENHISLVFRHLAPMSEKDIAQVKQFAIDHKVQTYLQPGGLDSIRPCYPADPQILYYSLNEYGLRIYFSATDFVQVNAQANQMLLKKAMELLNPRPGETILDLYCGLGNFSLPIARHCKQVFAVEGDASMVGRANFNARHNQVDNIEFQTQDLSDDNAEFGWLNRGYDKVLLDPARSGAAVMCEKLAAVKIPEMVYISCNPATLARDAGLLVNTHGYTLTHAGIINMFPYTAHVESIAVFKR